MEIEQTADLETFYDLTVNLTTDITSGAILEDRFPDSRWRFSVLIDWANEFNKLHASRDWDGDYFEVLDDFYAAKTADIRNKIEFNQAIQFTRASSQEIADVIGGA